VGVKLRHSHVNSENLTNNLIGGKLVLITNRKSHMGFRLVPKSVILNDTERRNDRVVCVISPNSVAFEAYYVKVVENTPIPSASEM